jgi:hypothetical protein
MLQKRYVLGMFLEKFLQHTSLSYPFCPDYCAIIFQSVPEALIGFKGYRYRVPTIVSSTRIAYERIRQSML